MFIISNRYDLYSSWDLYFLVHKNLKHFCCSCFLLFSVTEAGKTKRELKSVYLGSEYLALAEALKFNGSLF